MSHYRYFHGMACKDGGVLEFGQIKEVSHYADSTSGVSSSIDRQVGMYVHTQLNISHRHITHSVSPHEVPISVLAVWNRSVQWKTTQAM